MLRLELKNTISLEALDAFARGPSQRVQLSDKPELREWTAANHAFFLGRLEAGWPIYGAVTGFGSSSASRIKASETAQLQTNLFRYHGCGVGSSFQPEPLAAILLVRLNCLLQGCSGVSFELLERLALMADKRILPLIPQRGSVGASGDLTPLSYIAAAMAGEREVWFEGKVQKAADVWQGLGMKPYVFKAREALAIMNGTSVMAALAGLAWTKLERVYDILTWSTAAMVEIWQGPCSPFFAELHAVKPHPGQIEASAAILSHLHDPASRLIRQDRLTGSSAGSVQDPYSIRCAPQIIGAFKDALTISRSWIETEINSVNDNPVFLQEDELVLNGGHFLGQHITMACDLLKASLANVINLVDRQMALLLESRGRLPENLVAPELDANQHHGFKAMQISLSALASELAKMAMPLSAFSRPTEASNQDVVSLGTTAARELYDLTDMAGDALAIHVMALIQAFTLSPPEVTLNAKLQDAFAPARAVFPGLKEDAALDHAIIEVKNVLFRLGKDRS